MTALDVDAYLERIHWRGKVSPTFDTLAGLLDAHMTHIPFENLDVLLGRPISLDLSALEQKLVRARRGGYCFEHATLFAAVLERLGFQPVRHSARVTLFEPRTVSARTHMFLTVAIDRETFVIDPGFGFARAAPADSAGRHNGCRFRDTPHGARRRLLAAAHTARTGQR
jgi:N-hydroxyarylamine O-acetyltransferase